MPRKKTYLSRMQIGFPESPDQWSQSEAVFSPHKLQIFGHPVMEDWETGYMRYLAKIATSCGGEILEIGFGMGISAGFIQSHKISGHTIIEANAGVYKKLLAFAQTAKHPVTPRFGFWEDICPTMPDKSYSGILFDSYPIKKEDLHCNHYSFFATAHRLLKPGGILTYYSDESKNFSPLHRQKLVEAGFRQIAKRVCPVNPPKDCQYWQSSTLMVPIIRKGKR